MDRIILIHLSDVHLGSCAYANPVWRRLAALVANGHDNLLIDEFMTLWQLNQSQLRFLLNLSQSDKLNIIVTGDLTRVGSIRDFDLAWDFFHDDWSPPRHPHPPGTSPAGLNLQFVHATPPAGAHGPLPANPGNHDQWAGASWWIGAPAYNPSGFRSHIGPTNWHAPFVITEGALSIEIYGLDSNSGLAGASFQPQQGGVIAAAQLADLEASLQARGPADRGVVRVVLCHHGFDHARGWLAPLDASSRDELLRIATDHDVPVVLTGHSHYIDWRRWTTSIPTKKQPAKPVWELRSTTPFQGPATTPSFQGRLPTWQRTVCHGFLAHEVSISPGHPPTWNLHGVLWDGTRFKHYGNVNIPLF